MPTSLLFLPGKEFDKHLLAHWKKVANLRLFGAFTGFHDGDLENVLVVRPCVNHTDGIIQYTMPRDSILSSSSSPCHYISKMNFSMKTVDVLVVDRASLLMFDFS